MLAVPWDCIGLALRLRKADASPGKKDTCPFSEGGATWEGNDRVEAFEKAAAAMGGEGPKDEGSDDCCNGLPGALLRNADAVPGRKVTLPCSGRGASCEGRDLVEALFEWEAMTAAAFDGILS